MISYKAGVVGSHVMLVGADKAAIAEEIKGWTDALMAKPDAMLKQRSIIQLACAAVYAIKGSSLARWAALERHEGNLLQQALDSKSNQRRQNVWQLDHVSRA